jgi:hypothetical protein
MSRAAVTDYLSAFVWSALEGIARSYGVSVDTDGKLRLVDPAPRLVEPAPRPVEPVETPRGKDGA